MNLPNTALLAIIVKIIERLDKITEFVSRLSSAEALAQTITPKQEAAPAAKTGL